MRHLMTTGIVCLAVLSSTMANADVLDLSATAASKYAATGQHNFPFDTNYAAGNIAFVNTYRNYFVFDLSPLPANHYVVAAELFLQQPLGGYLSPDPTETYSLFEVTTPINELLTFYGSGNATGMDIFADLGSGTTLGSVDISAADQGTLVQIALGQDAIDLLNAAGTGLIAFGGAVTTMGHGPDEYEFVFGFTGDLSQRFLRVTTEEIPEPSAFVLGSIAALSAVMLRLRRRRRSTVDASP